jgi:hypothetical protein
VHDTSVLLEERSVKQLKQTLLPSRVLRKRVARGAHVVAARAAALAA